MISRTAPRTASVLLTANRTRAIIRHPHAGLIRRNGEFPLTDYRGNVRHMTDGNGTYTETTQADPFGLTVAQSGSSANPYLSNAGSGYRSDGDGPTYAAPLQKVGARYYDPEFGCFLTRDTDLSQRPYAYCDGDPVNCVDPTGHKTKKQPTPGQSNGGNDSGGTTGTGGDNPDGSGPGNHDPGTGPPTTTGGDGVTVTTDPNAGTSVSVTNGPDSATISRAPSGSTTVIGQSVIIFGSGFSATGGVKYNVGTGIGTSYGAVNFSSGGFSAGFSSINGFTAGYSGTFW